jgi:hypothetical protein
MVDSLVDATDLVGNLVELEKDLTAATLARGTSNDTSKSVNNVSDDKSVDADIPDKYRGKSLKDIISMHQNAESRLGVMANDLGTQRKLTDRLLDLKRETDLGNNSATEKVQIKSDELLENPTEALDRYLAPHEQRNQQRLDLLERQLAAQAFVTKHQDFQSYTNNSEFKEWVQQSPTRARAAQAAANGDWSAADDLLTEYKEGRKAPHKPQQDDTDSGGTANLEGARRASLESSSQSSSGAQKGKIYTRASLMRLRIEKPETYYSEDMQEEILRAYAEKRVK